MMLSNLLPIPAATLAAVLLLSLPRPAAAGGDDSAPPVTIAACTMTEDPALSNPKLGLRLSTTGGLTIVYAIERNTAATEVRFAARYGNETFTMIDRGNFAPQSKVSRTFSNFSAIYRGSSADCSVTSVRFADGSRWDPPTGAASPAPSVSPAPPAPHRTLRSASKRA